MFSSLDSIYDNSKVRLLLGWLLKLNFEQVFAQVAVGKPVLSPLARIIVEEGYHRK